MKNVTLIKHSPKARQLFDYRKEVAINKTYGFFLGYNLCGFKRGIISNNGQMHELMYLSLSKKWHNPLLQWNASEYGGIKSIQTSADKVWVPDILMYYK